MFFRIRNAVNQVVSARLDGRQQTRDLLRRVLQVVVHGHHEPSAAVAETAHQRIVLAKIPHELYEHDPIGIFPLKVDEHLPGVIRARIVDKNDLVRPRTNVQHGPQPPHDIRERVGRAIDGDDHRDMDWRWFEVGLHL